MSKRRKPKKGNPPKKATSNMENVFKALQTGQPKKGEKLCRQILNKNPNYPDALHYLGVALYQQGLMKEAADYMSQSVLKDSQRGNWLNNFGMVLVELGQLDDALKMYNQAAALGVDSAELYCNVGSLLLRGKQFKKAEGYFHEALKRDSKNVDALQGLGISLKAQDRIDLAVEALIAALELKPDNPAALHSLGAALMFQGRIDQAIDCFREVLNLQPDNVEAHSTLIMALNYSAKTNGQMIYSECLKFSEQFETPLQDKIIPLENDVTPTRKLRIGYVSADLYSHPVAFFIEPLLALHNKKELEVACYYNNYIHDEVTQRLREASDYWVDCAGMPDEDLAEKIRSDRVDILVDLSGHTAGNRLLTFARKPAPIQVTYMGFPCTTGLTAMDYRITDSYVDPPELTESIHSETLLRLPWLAQYREDEASPDVSEAPAVKNGYVTFAVFSSFQKLSEKALDLWCEILRQMVDARLMISVPDAEDDAMNAYVLEMFSSRSIDTNRIKILKIVPRQEYMESHAEVDILLNSIPYSGGTTICNSLWMGVPVISLSGDYPAARGGGAVLSAAGLGELIANTPEEYVRLSVELASDIPKLSKLRMSMRETIRCSRLHDYHGVVSNIESCYRDVWKKWCIEKG